MHERIAKVLGWTVEEAKSFSLLALREALRSAPASNERDALITAISEAQRTGSIIISRG